ncbi:SpoIIIAH-like family protein [Alkaliphilus sp. MSJ-5]|uniref:SpoIIIAH-like family protein n=1 Tax=Alkaliphilus flagellatus TaxID=2841507 RepID=A0ABS6G764_9FIRM|nr:SpoIIIAH-like family protein [Alkaliphilus flagellatus]MBU5677567.1 SpoIIIAH-like family protein [Alkaliphilus flagellatus]
MKFSVKARKNFVIFSLVLMLGVISYVNYNLNQQALLETSSELEKYELTMMEEHGLLDEEAVFKENEEVEVAEEAPPVGDELAVEGKEEIEKKEITNAVIVDSADTNELTELAQATNVEISETVTSKKLMKSNTYFIESKLERDKKRSEMISNLNDIINGQNTSEEIRDQAVSMKLNTITSTEKEVFIENMIMAKGFNDVIVYLSDQSINIVVSSDNLTEKDVAKIVDIVNRETDIAMDNIIIMSKK